MSTEKKKYIGIDTGSVTVSLVETDLSGNVLDYRYRYHYGKPSQALKEMLLEIDYRNVAGIARTSGSPDIITGAREFDSRISVINAVKRFYSNFSSILNVGGEKFALIEFDDEGNYSNLRSNTSCAAGTGAFLDQQAKRLNLADSGELSRKAVSNSGEVPRIASRCSVFAKTDIIHSQQEGYSLEEICDGLCLGLARNIADTLFDENIGKGKVIFAGGVSRNSAVVKHLEQTAGCDIEVHEYSHLFGAIGAAGLLIDELTDSSSMNFSAESVHDAGLNEREYFYDPLELKLTDYPDFEGREHYLFESPGAAADVEVDIYEYLETGSSIDVYMGIDIGSTSTKAIITDGDSKPVIGLYTRTAGRPIKAMQSIFRACADISRSKDINLNFEGVGSTGSGRKFIGKLIGADIILDEISAHAKAAADLDPDIDTIIEIGGQDAKFTTMRKGVVTFSQMNTVCAAGTGSFIEEQALKLGVSLDDYADLASGARAPLASDRCTVFMERDINHYLNKNYEINEILASVLFSVRENYLQKVATEGSIGKRVCFQGATARNRALVAAFEQKLGMPIFVSRFCHLTGALGAALTVREEKKGPSGFKGLDLYKQEIPVRSETCELCLNHCRIRIAEVRGEEVAYGFLCGRDYDTRQYVKKEKVPSLLKVRKKAEAAVPLPETAAEDTPVIGLPAALQVFEELPLWRYFFRTLGLRTVTSEKAGDVIARGKKIAGAEFCSPMAAFHGHVEMLAGKADMVFLPVHIDNGKDEKNQSRIRKYCYYTQFSSTLASKLEIGGSVVTSIRPVINHRSNILKTKYELFDALNYVLPGRFSFLDISKAYDSAQEYFRDVKSAYKALYSSPEGDEIKVVLTGRPYTVLSGSMNKDIPGYFAELGIETCFMDSLPQGEVSESVEPLLDQVHWAYPAAIIAAADYCSKTEGLYPVFVTSFKCSPDSFTIEYFKKIMDSREKPYLILQIDEHDSNVGYETRIEAGVRAFRNHLSSSRKQQTASPVSSGPVSPVLTRDIKGKTVLLPNWDPLVLPLISANLNHYGVDARVLEETPRLISSSMKRNTGQCIPVNAIAHEYVEYIRKYKLNPDDTVLWMIKSGWACNIAMYPSFIKTMVEQEAPELSNAGVYVGDLTMVDFSPLISIKTYFAYMFGGNLKKIGCMIRPYEVDKGETDRVISEAGGILEKAFSGELSFGEAVKDVIGRLDRIRYIKTPRPKVAIFGDLYVRDNEVMNQDLIHEIEAAGGEVLVTPYNDYAKIISSAHFKRLIKNLRLPDYIMYKSLLGAMEILEGRYHSLMSKYIGRPLSSRNPRLEDELKKFNIRLEQEGESYENILKIFRIIKTHPDISLFVQTNPAFCCPSLITEAMSRDIEKITGVPVLSITYDGTEASRNDIIIPYLKYAADRRKSSSPDSEGIRAV